MWTQAFYKNVHNYLHSERNLTLSFDHYCYYHCLCSTKWINVLIVSTSSTSNLYWIMMNERWNIWTFLFITVAHTEPLKRKFNILVIAGATFANSFKQQQQGTHHFHAIVIIILTFVFWPTGNVRLWEEKKINIGKTKSIYIVIYYERVAKRCWRRSAIKHQDECLKCMCVWNKENKRTNIRVYNSILGKHIKLVAMTLAVTFCANDCWSE